MTRKEAQASVETWIDMVPANKVATWHYGRIELRRDIDTIYDDFESRICGNCKLAETSECILYDSYYKTACDDPTFGCNKFERK